MTWSISKTARRFAADGEITAAFVAADKAVDDPVSRRVLRRHKDFINELLKDSPHDCDVTVSSYGGFDNDGFGGATFSFSVARHTPPAEPVVVAAEEPVPEPEPDPAPTP